MDQRERQRRSAPSPNAPRACPGRALSCASRAKPDLRWGEGWATGGCRYCARCIRQLLLPPPTPPHKGADDATINNKYSRDINKLVDDSAAVCINRLHIGNTSG